LVDHPQGPAFALLSHFLDGPFFWLAVHVTKPARLLSIALGWQWERHPEHWDIQFGVVILTDAVLSLLLGTLVGWLVQKYNNYKEMHSL